MSSPFKLGRHHVFKFCGKLNSLIPTLFDVKLRIEEINAVPYKCMFSPFPKCQNLNSSKFKDFADDNFEFDENGGKFSKIVENTEGKEEIAHYELFLLVMSNFCFSHCVFKRLVLQTRKNRGLFGKQLSLSQAAYFRHNLELSKLKQLADNSFNLMKMAKSSQKG